MRKGLLVFLLFLATSLNAQDIDVIHYKFEISLNDNSDSIEGKTEIKFIFKAQASPITFELANLKTNGKGMQVSSASILRRYIPVGTNGESIDFSHDFLHKDDKLTLPLLNYLPVYQFKAGDTATAVIIYKGIPDDGLIISKNKFGERTFFGDNWPNRAHHWLPCIDSPNDKATFEFLVTAPEQYNVISNGEKIEEKDLGDGKRFTHWKEDIALPTKVMVIGAGRFATKTYDNSPENLPISAWLYPQDSAKGVYDFGVAPEIVKFLSDYIAPFPYNKLANVQSTTIFGGMENASCIFYDERIIKGNRSSEDVVAHEIAHQWFGDMVSEKSFAHLWLSEGFATYLTNLYWEQKYGREAMNERLENDREKVIEFAESSSRPVVDSTDNLMSLLNANSYQKGGWILHMLHNEVGDSTFREIIETFYNQYKGGNAETRDFEAVAEKVSGKDLKWFFDQWLYRAGIPKVYVSQTISGRKLSLRISQIGGDIYRLPLTLLITTKNAQEKWQRVTLTKPETTLELSLPKGKFESVILDPDSEVLFERVTSHKRGIPEN